MAKARGFTISLEKMNEQERVRTPTGAFGDDYNRLLASAKELLPNIATLLPPQITSYKGANGDVYADSSYREMDVFCEQIFQLLAECED